MGCGSIENRYPEHHPGLRWERGGRDDRVAVAGRVPNGTLRAPRGSKREEIVKNRYLENNSWKPQKFIAGGAM